MAAALAFMMACSSSNELSRSKAKSLIDESTFATDKPRCIKITEAEDHLATDAGYWQHLPGNFGHDELLLTNKGDLVFDGEGGKVVNSTVCPKGSVKRQVAEITGIVDASLGSGAQVKIAEFTWNWDVSSLGDEKSIFKDQTPYKGEAYFMHYDDGWRLKDVKRTGS